MAAEEYRRAAICLETYGILVGQGLDSHLSMPMGVHYAFAAELYLKFLYCVHTTRDIPATHDLENIFNNLPKNVRPIIKRQWDNPPEIEKQIRAAISAHTGRPIPTFEAVLKRSALIYVKIRYHFENQEIRDFDIQLATAFRAAIFEIYPTEYADVRLALPTGALNANQQNVVKVAVRKPANPPEKSS